MCFSFGSRVSLNQDVFVGTESIVSITWKSTALAAFHCKKEQASPGLHLLKVKNKPQSSFLSFIPKEELTLNIRGSWLIKRDSGRLYNLKAITVAFWF